MGQTPIEFCGVIVKPPLENGQVARFYDRFGNEYTEYGFPYPGDGSGAYKLTCIDSYFNLVFIGTWTPNEEATICRVFFDLSAAIDNPSGESINLLIEKTPLNNGILGTGSPVWEAECGIADSRIIERLNNIFVDEYPEGYLGLMQIHEPDQWQWHTYPEDDTGDPNLGINPNNYDLYSVALHEALHILGFGSRISTTGAAMNGFYSQWDRFLYSVVEDSRLIYHAPITECCNAYEFNDIDFDYMPNDFAYGCPLELAFRNDDQVILAPVNVANYSNFSGGSGENIFLNKLSHLDNSCADEIGITGTMNYVMHPAISAGEIRRTLTDAELHILCALGYHIIDLPGVENCDQPCEVFTNPDTYQIYLEGEDANNPLVIPISSLLANDVVPVGAPFSFDFDCMYIGSLDIDVSNFPISIEIEAFEPGIYKFCYTVENCNGICQIEEVTVLVNNSPVEIQCYDPYCNIICFGDFEDFETFPDNDDNSSNYYPGLGVDNFVFSDLFSGNTPDVKIANTDNNVLGIGWIDCTGCHKESASIPLSDPIPDQCTVTVSFNAFAFQQTISASGLTAAPTLLITALTDYPCPAFPYESINCITPTSSICTPPVYHFNMTTEPCGIELQDPIVTSSPLSSIINPTLSTLDFTQTPFYTFTWTNNTGFDITTLLLTGNNSVGNFVDGNIQTQYLVIDNLEAYLECKGKVNIAADDPDEICRGTSVSIPYTLCFENSDIGSVVNTTIQTNVSAIPGISVIPGGLFTETGTAEVTLSYDDPCITIDLNLLVGIAFTDGQQVTITAELTNVDASTNQLYCTFPNSEGLEVVLTIIDCGPIDPPYDCLDMTNFFTVNTGNPEVYTLSEYGEDRISYAPSSSQTWEPGSHPFVSITGSLPVISFNVDLVIPQGIDLTIDGMQLLFAPDKRILVQPGATLALKNTIIDGVCEVMWTGIQVEGPGMDIQPNSNNAGKLSMEQSHVKNAVLGVVNMNLAPLNNAEMADISPPNNPYFNISSLVLPSLFEDVPAKSTSGGLLNIISSSFTGCFQGINVSWNNLLPYTFQDNEFLYPSSTLWFPFNAITTQPEAGIYAHWCDRVGIINCFFEKQKYGVRANFINSLVVSGSKFENDVVGISSRHYKDLMSQYSTISDNEFTDCQLSVQVDGNEFCRITDNIVNETGNSILAFADLTAGFYFRGSNVYCVNNFLHRTHFGIILNQSDVTGTLIAGNLVNNTMEAIITEGDNSQAQLWCNHLLDYLLHGLDHRAFSSSNGILPQQGLCDDFDQIPAANTFMAAAGMGVSDVRLGPELFGGFGVETLIYYDVDATTLSVTDLSSLGGFSAFDCNPIDLNPYCSNQGYTPFEDVSEYVGLEIMDDRDLAQEILRLLADSSYTEAIDLLRRHNTSLIAQRRLIPYYIGVDSLVIAQNLLDQISADKEEDIRFTELNQLLLDLRADNRTIFEISQAEEDLLLDIAESGTKTSYKAQAILYAARGTDFPVVLPALASGGDNWYSSFKSVNSKISPLYPNPSNYTATISYELQTGEEAIFSFYSPLGQILETTVFTHSGNYLLDIHKYTSGLYFYTVSINGKPVVNNKFIVIK